MLFFGGDDFSTSLSVSVMLIMIAIGVFMIVKCSIIWGSFQMLLEEDDYTPQAKLESKKNAPVAGIYWLAVTAVFLAWSFITNSWDRSWIIWPVAGVCFGIVSGIMSMLRKKG